jgi:hypothetical protein
MIFLILAAIAWLIASIFVFNAFCETALDSPLEYFIAAMLSTILLPITLVIVCILIFLPKRY